MDDYRHYLSVSSGPAKAFIEFTDVKGPDLMPVHLEIFMYVSPEMLDSLIERAKNIMERDVRVEGKEKGASS